MYAESLRRDPPIFGTLGILMPGNKDKILEKLKL
jgi:hypothetical protein